MSNPYNIQEIRILPMDKEEEFMTEEEVRKYLSVDLIQKYGKYYFRKRGILLENKNACVLILFQYNASIIGYGILKEINPNDPCKDWVNGKLIQYKGYFQFLTMSIHNISPISLEEIQRIDENITHFSNSKWRIEIEYYDQICDLLLNKQVEFMQNKI